MAKFIVTCPTCGKNLKASAEHIGKKAKCTGCGNPVLVQAPEPEPPEESESNEDSWPFSDEPAALPPKRQSRVTPPVVTEPVITQQAMPQGTHWTRRQYSLVVLAVAATVSLAVGYFAGREHLKYQMSAAIREAGEQFAKGMGSALAGSSSAAITPDSVVSETVEESVPEIEIGDTHRCNTVEITATSASIGKVPMKEGFERVGDNPDEPLLLVQFMLRNPSDRKLLSFNSTNIMEDRFRAEDDVQNSLRSVKFSSSRALVGVLDNRDELPPGESRTHIEMFDKPLPKTKFLLLTVDCETFGSDGKVAIRIPVDKIAGF